MAVVIDTNVLHVANQNSQQAGPRCLLNVIDRLTQVKDHEKVCLDETGLILAEYIAQRFNFSGQPGFGDAFFTWLFDNQANAERCELVPIVPTNDELSFSNFPRDLAIAGFDLSDRKFVAVALASDLSPSVLNAVDSDWWIHEDELERCGIVVENLCGQEIPTA